MQAPLTAGHTCLWHLIALSLVKGTLATRHSLRHLLCACARVAPCLACHRPTRWPSSAAASPSTPQRITQQQHAWQAGGKAPPHADPASLPHLHPCRMGGRQRRCLVVAGVHVRHCMLRWGSRRVPVARGLGLNLTYNTAANGDNTCHVANMQRHRAVQLHLPAAGVAGGQAQQLQASTPSSLVYFNAIGQKAQTLLFSCVAVWLTHSLSCLLLHCWPLSYTVVRYNTRDALPDVLDDVTCVKLLRELIDWAATHPLMRRLADTRRVYMTGHSRGAKLAALTAAVDPRVAALFLMDPVDVTQYAPLSDR